MIKTVKNKSYIPLIDINKLEEDGINALERVKLDMAIQMVCEMSKELFNTLFQITIIDPNDKEQYKKYCDLCAKQSTNYNKAIIEQFREAQNRQIVIIEMKIEINEKEKEN